MTSGDLVHRCPSHSICWPAPSAQLQASVGVERGRQNRTHLNHVKVHFWFFDYKFGWHKKKTPDKKIPNTAKSFSTELNSATAITRSQMLKLSWQNKKTQKNMCYKEEQNEELLKWLSSVIDKIWATMRARGTSSSLLMLFRLLRTRFSQLACVREHTHTHTQKHLASNNTNALVSKQKRNVSKTLQARAESQIGGRGGRAGEEWRRSETTDWPEPCACRPAALWDALEEPPDGSGAAGWDKQTGEEGVLQYASRQGEQNKDTAAFLPEEQQHWRTKI